MTVPVTFSGPAKSDLEPDGQPEDLSEVIDFSSYDLRTTIRLIVSSGESRRLDVRRGSKRGAIFIRGGEIYRVVADQSQGDEALFEILSWDKTSHCDSRESDAEERNVRISTEVFLDLLEKQNP
ncbi:MAG: DUF4388 domain-containing protein [Thermodesulfobacteriota bacterium]